MTHLFLLVLFCLAPLLASAHPMDLGQLDIVPAGDRFVATLRLHKLAADRLIPHPSADFTHDIFAATLEPSVPKLNALTCLYLAPELKHDGDYLSLRVVTTCPEVANASTHFTWSLPFLEKMSDAFQLMTSMDVNSERVTLIANRRHPAVEFGESSRTFRGFLKMGMGHIGATPEEWVSRDGTVKLPDGNDHILFVLALVLAGGTLWGLFKTATGFTVGHSITLALSTYKIIHVHSKWIEVGIAFSIAYVAGRAFWKKGSRAENWIVASLFGIVHGLGFSAALQDLELTPSEMRTALAGFNIGVEVGQCIYILLFLGVLYALKKISARLEQRVQRALALVICAIGLYWVYYRGFV